MLLQKGMFFSVHVTQDAHTVFSTSPELDELHHMVTVCSLYVLFCVLFLLRDEVLMIRLGLRWCSTILLFVATCLKTVAHAGRNYHTD